MPVKLTQENKSAVNYWTLQYYDLTENWNENLLPFKIFFINLFSFYKTPFYVCY